MLTGLLTDRSQSKLPSFDLGGGRSKGRGKFLFLFPDFLFEDSGVVVLLSVSFFSIGFHPKRTLVHGDGRFDIK